MREMTAHDGGGPRPSAPRLPAHRLAVLALGVASALGGLDAALVRLGAVAPVSSLDLGDIHGALMIYGFLGTVICLERAVSLRSGSPGNSAAGAWAFAAPLAAGLGGVLAILQAFVPAVARAAAALVPSTSAVSPTTRLLPGVAWCAAMALLTAIYVTIWRTRHPSYALLVQLLGALSALGGMVLWTAGRAVPDIVVWWLTFLVLTIVGERLELARVGFLAGSRTASRTEPRILLWACALALSLPLTLVAPGAGYPALGLALGLLIVDTGLHDVARRTIRLPGLPRLAGACMLSGYVWALVPAGLWLLVGQVPSGHGYDIAVHSITLGFTVSMILAHAPVIVPAIIRRPLPYHPALWAVWGLLEGGLALRTVAGIRASEGAWRLGGALGVSAMLMFLVVAVTLVATSPGASPDAPAARPSDPARVTP